MMDRIYLVEHVKSQSEYTDSEYYGSAEDLVRPEKWFRTREDAEEYLDLRYERSQNVPGVWIAKEDDGDLDDAPEDLRPDLEKEGRGVWNPWHYTIEEVPLGSVHDGGDAVEDALDNLNTFWMKDDIAGAVENAGHPVTEANINALAKRINRGFSETIIGDINERIATSAEHTDFPDGDPAMESCDILSQLPEILNEVFPEADPGKEAV